MLECPIDDDSEWCQTHPQTWNPIGPLPLEASAVKSSLRGAYSCNLSISWILNPHELSMLWWCNRYHAWFPRDKGKGMGSAENVGNKRKGNQSRTEGRGRVTSKRAAVVKGTFSTSAGSEVKVQPPSTCHHPIISFRNLPIRGLTPNTSDSI